jgi:hypothetical protein
MQQRQQVPQLDPSTLQPSRRAERLVETSVGMVVRGMLFVEGTD